MKMKKHKEKDKPKPFTDHSTLLGRFRIFFLEILRGRGGGIKEKNKVSSLKIRFKKIHLD